MDLALKDTNEINDIEEKWKGLPIKYLVFSNDNYIVFIDYQNDIDWKANDEFELERDGLPKEDKAKFHNVINNAASIESIPCDDLEDKVIVNFKRQVGEALVRNFHFDFVNATKMLALSREYIVDRNADKSRYLYLKASGVTTLFFSFWLVVFWLCRNLLIQEIGMDAFILSLCLFAGSLGAFLSIVLRVGNTNLDYHASKKLHFMEGGTKVVAGSISAFLIALCIKSGILLPIFTKVESTHLAMFIGAMIGGASERLAPSIIKKIEGSKDKKHEA